MNRRLRAIAAAAAVLLPAAPCGWAKDVPYLTGRVNDQADLIPADVEARIEEKLAALESATGAQVAVLTIESLEGEVLEEYSLKVAETWALGREDADDGLLLLIARDDRKMRLEVGYGLEGQLTDLQSGRILNNILRPRFREGDFGGGIEAGVDAIVGTLQGEEVIPPDPPRSSSGTDISDTPLLAQLLIMGIFLLVVGTFSLAAIFGSGCHSWFLWLFLTPFWSTFPMVLHPLAGAICGLGWLVGFPLLKLFLGKTKAGKEFVSSHPVLTTFASSGWRSGGGSGGWSGGGFSGGGGSFGGGGASSSW